MSGSSTDTWQNTEVVTPGPTKKTAISDVHHRRFTVVGVDPGLANLGIGALAEEGRNEVHLLGSLLITTNAAEDQNSRLRKIRDQVHGFLELHEPDALAIEGQFFHHQKAAAFKVGQAFGIVRLCAADLDIPVFEYGPLQVKQALVGNGRADKAQVAYMVRALLKLKSTPGVNHVSDALGLALTHLQSRRIASLR